MSRVNLASGGRRRAWLAALILVGTVAFRFLGLGRLHNDHFVHLSRAFNLLQGDWPVRDFEDPGLPLMTLASAAAMAAFGQDLLTEVLLCAAMLGVAAMLTFLAASRLTGSLALGAFAAGLQVAAGPRLYNYPKLLVHAVGVWLFVVYARHPTGARAASLGLLIGVAFLFRHDHAIYLAASTLAVLAIMHADAPRLLAQRAAACLLTAAGVVSIYIAYVAAAANVGTYLTAALEFSATEAARTSFTFHSVAQAPLLGATLLGLPVIAAAVLTARRRHLPPAHCAPVAGAIVLLALVSAGFLRDSLPARGADVYAPASIVLAWLVAVAVRPLSAPAPKTKRHGVTAAALVAFAALFTLSTLRLGNQEVYYTGVLLIRRLPWHAANVTRGLREWPWSDYTPESLPPAAVRYIDTCTPPDRRVLVGWFAPETAFIVRRPFAAGVPAHVPGYYQSADAQERALRRLRQDPAAIVLMRRDTQPQFEATWAEVTRYVAEHYRPLWSAEQRGNTVDLYAHTGLIPEGTDSELNLPCFAAKRAAGDGVVPR